MSSLFASITPTPTAAPKAGGAKAARQALKDVREDAQAMLKGAGAPVAASVSTIGAYDPASFSLLQDLKTILSSIKQLFSHLFAPATPVPPTPTQPSTPTQPTHPTTPTTPTQPTKPPATAKGKTNFTISSFNILGSSHTAPGGDAKGYASGVARTRMAVQLLKQKKIDIVGFQEMNNDQAREFKRVASDTYGLYPGAVKGAMMSQNSIAWRKDQWDFVSGSTIKVRSHKGNMWPVPIVKLRNKETGKEAYFCNFHNAPGFSKGLQQKNRDEATTQEVALLKKLKKSGLPVIVTGDMNEKQNYHRRLSKEAGMHSANENAQGKLPKNVGIDWIFGSAGVKFKGYYRERGAFEKKISDHGMIASQVTLAP